MRQSPEQSCGRQSTASGSQPNTCRQGCLQIQKGHPVSHTPAQRQHVKTKGPAPARVLCRRSPPCAPRPAPCGREQTAALGSCWRCPVFTTSPLLSLFLGVNRPHGGQECHTTHYFASHPVLKYNPGPGAEQQSHLPCDPELADRRRDALCELSCDGERSPGGLFPEAPEEFPTLTRPCAPSSVSEADEITGPVSSVTGLPWWSRG